jgi:hypothetical protein
VDEPFTISPVVSPVIVKGKKIDVTLKPFSFTVIKLGMK